MVYGQLTNGGNFIVGTSVGLSSANSNIIQDDAEGEGPQSSQFSISPKVGYFIMDNLAIGIGLDYTRSLVKEPNEDRNLDSDLLFGPYARYYLPLADDVALFIEGSFGFGNSTSNLLIGGETRNISTNIFAVGFGPGLTVFSDQGFSISAIFKYNFARSNFDTDIGGVQRSTIAKTNQFNFSVGVSYYFTALRPAIYTP
jgi:hypothetical protein